MPLKVEPIEATEAPAEFEQWVAILPELVKAFQAMGMATVDTAPVAVQQLLRIKLAFATIEGWKKDQSKPYSKARTEVTNHYKHTLELLGELETRLKDQLTTLAGAREAARQKAIREGTKPPEPLELEGVRFDAYDTFKVINADIVPYDFCSPDPEKIAAHMKEQPDVAIPGVKFFTKFRVVASAKGEGLK